MNQNEWTAQKVHDCYWSHDLNCAKTTLETLSGYNGMVLSAEVYAAATGMHGAGKYGAQCGLMEGALMFIGILGTSKGLDATRIAALCNEYAGLFVKRFGALECRILRPGGFRDDDPPHACESLTCNAILFCMEFLAAKPELDFENRC